MDTSESAVNGLSGILNVLKPPGMTSFDVVGYLRSLLKIKKIGHTGTLDPAAVGVLPVCIGRATKAIEYITGKDKCYRAELTLGAVTDTQDSTGAVLETRRADVSSDEIKRAVESFKGKSMQTPPMYSAVKVGGRKLYELAREGVSIERKPRQIEVYSINVLGIRKHGNGAESGAGAPGGTVVTFDVACSKGTYIRTLCADIGERLGCGGHMSFLVRLKAGIFDIAGALTLEEISELAGANRLIEKMVRVDEVFKELKQIRLDDFNARRIINGAAVDIDGREFIAGQTVRVYASNGGFIGLGRIAGGQERLQLKQEKLF